MIFVNVKANARDLPAMAMPGSGVGPGSRGAGGSMLIWLSDFGTLSDGIHVHF